MLTAPQLAEFVARGFVRLPRAFAPEAGRVMCERIWSVLGRDCGVAAGDPSTWTGAQACKLQELHDDPAFAAIGSDVTCGAIDAVLGAGAWQPPRHWGQILVSFPTAARRRTIPTEIWHTDFGFLAPADEPQGVLVFSFLGDVEPGCGGTAVIVGSHRLLRQFVRRQPPEIREKMKRVRRAFMQSEPWLRDLGTPSREAARIERFTKPEEVAGVPVFATELCGNAGDVIIGHPWLLHASSTNRGTRPRMMCVQRVRLRRRVPDSVSSRR